MNDVHDTRLLARLDLNLLRVFDAVYRARSLTRAADELALSQSAVSHALARLRDQLGPHLGTGATGVGNEPLFPRDGRGVAPSALARRLAPRVREALAALGRALADVQDFQPDRDLRQAVIAMPEAVEPALLPVMMARLRQHLAEGSSPRLDSVRLDRATMKADLARGRMDLAVDVALAPDPDLCHLPLLRDDYCLVAAAGHAPVDLDGYRTAAHIAVSSRRSGPAVEDYALLRLGIQRKIALRCQRYETACRVVAETGLNGGGLLLTMGRHHGQPLVDGSRGTLNILPLPLDMPPLAFNLYWHRTSDTDPASRWLRDVLRPA
ncbi:LysR family transcriptional regulator [Nitrospirillum sp. BR 11752]|uniref:LysR family transcriptional regulator n=1 Tax=Nitrospirillum amazonense TaxID=28077 RepID=A0A560HB45_9PROT|nr:LysR family transcriptional regulator [Nitrospirillum amazonense]MEE3623116.1 LysR family transcriptional regulator [Nitrospirillum sp. BR 11752]TWB42720.1 LysR family transcriptional regulator [Nitrospirillum amazonense]